MRSDVPLDFAVFQLTPTRTRCELFVTSGKDTEKLASGLLKPFLAHLRAAEEQIDRGGYSIKLQPGPGFGDADPHDAPWFTKGTMERFVRFVSTPEILERVSTVEAELSQIEEDISIQASESSRVDIPGIKNPPATPPSASKVLLPLSLDKPETTPKSRRDSLDGGETPEAPDSSKKRLLRAMDARRLMLQKEQGMAFARAAAAGFDMPHMSHLLVFADCFGATRLRDATVKYMALCKKRQEAGLWIEEMELAAAEATAPRFVPVNLEGSFAKPKDQSTEMWPQNDGVDLRVDEFRDNPSMQSHGSGFVDGRGMGGEDMGGRGYSRLDFLQQRRSDGQARGNTRSPSRMDMDGDQYLSRGHSLQPGVDDYHDQEVAERFYAEDGALPSNGAGSRRPQTLSPPPQKFSLNMYNGGYAGEIGHDSGVRGPQSRRSWATNPAQNAPGLYASGPQSDRDYHHDSRIYYSSQNSQSGYHPNQIAYVDGNGGQGMWPHPQMQAPDQHWRSGPGYNEGLRFGHPGEQGPSYPQQPESGAGYAHMMSQAERNANAMGVAAGQAQSGTEQMVSDQDSVSPPDQEVQSPSHKIVRHLAPRSPSPKRRSSSPLRKVQFGRGARRSSMVVIRNINYITSNQGENGEKIATEKESDASESVGETDVEEDEGGKKRGSLSVKDAISLFEVKKTESSDGSRRRVSKQGRRQGSTDSAASSACEKPVLRRWSAAGDFNRGSSSILKSDVVDDNGDSQKIVADDIPDSSLAEVEASREAYALPKPRDAGDETLGLPARRPLPSHSGFDPSAEAAGPPPTQIADDVQSLGPSEEVLPGWHRKPATRASLQWGPENEGVLSRGQGDDSFMIPDRVGRVDASSNRVGSQDDELIQAELPKVAGDSYILPARASTNEQSGLGWRSELHLESEMPEEQQITPEKESKPSAQHDLFMMPDRQDSAGWSTAVDHSMEIAMDASDQKIVTPGGRPGVDSPKEHKGRLYEQYREKRDAKLRDVPGSKKAERDAKLKAMQDVLEKRKAEMSARGGRMADKHAPSVDAQLRAEKLRAFKADLARTKKEKDEEERKRLEEMRSQRRERIAARSSPSSGPSAQSATGTPRASLRSSMTKPIPMQKLASPQKVANGSVRASITSLSPLIPRTSRLMQRKSSTVPSTPDNPLSRSVPSFAELRKENTKPASLRSSIHDRASFRKATSIPAVRASTAPLEANGMRPARRAAAVINDDKKRQSMGTRKSLSALSLYSSPDGPDAPALKVSKALLAPEQNGTSKPTRRLSLSATAVPEAKPFLRKGKGLAPAAGPVIRKPKEGSPPTLRKKSEETVTAASLPVVPPLETPKQTQGSPAALVPDESVERGASAPDAAQPVQAPTSTATVEPIRAPPSLPDTPEPKAPELITEVTEEVGQQGRSSDPGQAPEPPYIVHIEDYASPSEPTTSTSYAEKQSQGDEVHVVDKLPKVSSSATSSPANAGAYTHSSGAQRTYVPSQPSVASPSRVSQQNEVYVAPKAFPSPPQSPPQAAEVTYEAPVATFSDSSALYEAPTAVASTSPCGSPVSESYPVLQATLSPEAANVKSRKKWGSSHKVATRANSISKEEPKGLRKLLNFGRKSRSSGSNANDWVSASTASEGNGDGNGDDEVSSDRGATKPTKKAEQRSKAGVQVTSKPARAAKPTKSSRSASAMRDSISKDVDVDVDVDERSIPAPRSFFSLSSFRSSKGSEAKSRS